MKLLCVTDEAYLSSGILQGFKMQSTKALMKIIEVWLSLGVITSDEKGAGMLIVPFRGWFSL